MRRRLKKISKILLLIFIFEQLNLACLIPNYSNIAYADTYQSLINIDGNDSDWNINNIISLGSGNITNISSLLESNRLNILVRGTSLDVQSNFYIDADNNSLTGYHCWAWQNSGIDYMVENNTLYKYTGSGNDWSWANVSSISIAKNSNVIELGIDLIKMDNYNADKMKIGYCREGKDYIPAINQQMVNVQKPQRIQYDVEKSKKAGIINNNGMLVLDTKYNEPNKFVIYYGELAYSGITDYSEYDFMVVFDRNVQSIAKARRDGCKIFQYLYFGSRFKDTDEFISDFKSQILNLKNNGLADGIFFDECDVEYWGTNYSKQQDKCQAFYNRLKEITDYCKSIGVKTVVNGTRAFCDLGDYYLWESFLGTWDTNKLIWSNEASNRTVADNSSVTYKLPLSSLKLEGSCYFDGTSIKDGSNGAVELLINTNDILNKIDQKDSYEWPYFEWFGEGADDQTCQIWAWTGDELPFNENTWKKLPKLWKGEPYSWDGMCAKSKYIKLRMEFNGANNLNIKSILLTYGIAYSYQNMNNPNGEADTNPYMWNNNNSQRDYLVNKMNASGNNVKVLTHTYGASDDYNKMMYTYLGTKIGGFYSGDYVHPQMQTIYKSQIDGDPLGLLINKYGENTANFTGGSASIDTVNNTYTLRRDEPSYWYYRAANIDGEKADWNSTDTIYSNKDNYSFNNYSQYWGVDANTFSTGTYNNLQYISQQNCTGIMLSTDGTGSWTSPVIPANAYNRKSLLRNILWNSSGPGTVSYYCKFQLNDGTWTDWKSIPSGGYNCNLDFIAFQTKVELSGTAPQYFLDSNGHSTLEPGVCFWGSSCNWDVYLNENINVRNISVKDDSKSLYLSFSVAGSVAFSKNQDIPSEYNYYIYLDSENDAGKGFVGEWWKTTFGTNYRISNNGIFKWNDAGNGDRTDAKNWSWIGGADLTYKISEDKKFIEYRISKETLGGLNANNLKLFMHVEEAKTHFGKIFTSDKNVNLNDLSYLPYNQKYYKQKTPHGWYTSDEIDVNNGNADVLFNWKENKPAQTNVKAWIRTRKENANWTEWKEVSNKDIVSCDASKLQYCFGLYTSNGSVSPSVSDIRILQSEAGDFDNLKLRMKTILNKYEGYNITDTLSFNEVLYIFLMWYAEYHRGQYLEATYNSIPDNYKTKALKHWISMVEQGCDQGDFAMNLLPLEYVASIPDAPLYDTNFGIITNENKYTSTTAFNYYVKYIYAKDVFNEINYKNFINSPENQKAVIMSHYQPWARYMYGSSAAELKSEFAVGIFIGITFAPMRTAYDMIEGIKDLDKLPGLCKFILLASVNNEYRQALIMMMSQAVEEWKIEYDNAEPFEKGRIIGNLIGQTLINACAVAETAEGIKNFVKSGGFATAFKGAADAVSRLKNIFNNASSKIDELFASIKKINKFDSCYEVVTPDGMIVRIERSEISNVSKIDEIAEKSAKAESAASRGAFQSTDEIGEAIVDIDTIDDGLGSLDWDAIVSKKGETRIDHINRHGAPKPERASHGVFYNNPVEEVNKAWAKRSTVTPIDDTMGGYIYNIPVENVAYESGTTNTGKIMNYVTIVTKKNTNELFAAFPSFGDYGSQYLK